MSHLLQSTSQAEQMSFNLTVFIKLGFSMQRSFCLQLKCNSLYNFVSCMRLHWGLKCCLKRCFPSYTEFVCFHSHPLSCSNGYFSAFFFFFFLCACVYRVLMTKSTTIKKEQYKDFPWKYPPDFTHNLET